MDGASAADAALETLRADLINIVLGTVFLTVGADSLRHRSDPLAQGRSHPAVVGSLERDGRPSKTGPDAHHFDGSAALSHVCRPLFEYGGHVPALDFCLVRLARAERGPN